MKKIIECCLIIANLRNLTSFGLRPQILFRNQWLSRNSEIQLNSGEDLYLECTGEFVEWLVPANEEYFDYSNPYVDARLEKYVSSYADNGTMSTLLIKDLKYTDTGLYKCVPNYKSYYKSLAVNFGSFIYSDYVSDSNAGRASTMNYDYLFEESVYVFVKDNSNLLLHPKEYIVSSTAAKFYFNCKKTDLNAQLSVFINRNRVDFYRFDKRQGILLGREYLHMFSPLNEIKCIARNFRNVEDTFVQLHFTETFPLIFVKFTTSTGLVPDEQVYQKDKTYEVWCIAWATAMKLSKVLLCPCDIIEGSQKCETQCWQVDAKPLFPPLLESNEARPYAMIANVTATLSGTLLCSDNSTSTPFVVSDVPNAEENGGFVIELQILEGQHSNGSSSIFELDSILIVCKINKFKDSGYVSWLFKAKGERIWTESQHIVDNGLTEVTSYSNLYQVRIDNILRNQSGFYKCSQGVGTKNVNNEQFISINVHFKPTEGNNGSEKVQIVLGDSKLTIKCDAQGEPTPQIFWTKDNKELQKNIRTSFSSDNKTITIDKVAIEDEGVYVCTMRNIVGETSSSFHANLFKESQTLSNTLSWILSVVLVIATMLTVYGIFVVRKHRNAIKKLIRLKESLEYGDHGELVVDYEKSINEQPENLFLDPKFIIPPSVLTVNKERRLGKGQFGEVFQAALNVDEPIIAAAKTIQSSLCSVHEQSLSEVKIMIHIGVHVNVLSLIGVVTENLSKGQLCIVTELCAEGSLLDFIKTRYQLYFHEANQREGCQNPSSANSTNYKVPQLFNTSVYHRFHVENDNIGLKKKCCTADLICFAYQIANGMNFLSSKSVIHRDLAARNVFVTHNSLIRIADFGLSRRAQIYQIQRSKNIPLPFAHMAPESLFDGEWSTKSDVWSFGVLLCEIFSLGDKPAQNLEYNEKYMEDIKTGAYPQLPEYSSQTMNELMLNCWNREECQRPTYVECCNAIGQLLAGHCPTCFTNLNVLLNDTTKNPDYSNTREEIYVKENLSNLKQKKNSKRRKENLNLQLECKNGDTTVDNISTV